MLLEREQLHERLARGEREDEILRRARRPLLGRRAGENLQLVLVAVMHGAPDAAPPLHRDELAAALASDASPQRAPGPEQVAARRVEIAVAGPLLASGHERVVAQRLEREQSFQRRVVRDVELGLDLHVARPPLLARAGFGSHWHRQAQQRPPPVSGCRRPVYARGIPAIHSRGEATPASVGPSPASPRPWPPTGRGVPISPPGRAGRAAPRAARPGPV